MDSSAEIDSTYPQPLVDAFGMEFMGAGQHPQQLTRLEITHAHHARRLVTCEGRESRGARFRIIIVYTFSEIVDTPKVSLILMLKLID